MFIVDGWVVGRVDVVDKRVVKVGRCRRSDVVVVGSIEVESLHIWEELV